MEFQADKLIFTLCTGSLTVFLVAVTLFFFNARFKFAFLETLLEQIYYKCGAGCNKEQDDRENTDQRGQLFFALVFFSIVFAVGMNVEGTADRFVNKLTGEIDSVVKAYIIISKNKLSISHREKFLYKMAEKCISDKQYFGNTGVNCETYFKKIKAKYYHAKNKVFSRESHFNEMQEMERRTQFIRSILFIDILFAAIGFITFLLVLLGFVLQKLANQFDYFKHLLETAFWQHIVLLRPLRITFQLQFVDIYAPDKFVREKLGFAWAKTEALALSPDHSKLFIGVRAVSHDHTNPTFRVIILSYQIAQLAAKPKLIVNVNLTTLLGKPEGISALEYAPELDRFIALTSYENDDLTDIKAQIGGHLWVLPKDLTRAKNVTTWQSYKRKSFSHKPEGVDMLGNDRIITVFDDDIDRKHFFELLPNEAFFRIILFNSFNNGK